MKGWMGSPGPSDDEAADAFRDAVRSSPVVREWKVRAMRHLEVEVRIGPLELSVDFVGDGEGAWERSWAPVASSMVRRRDGGGTGTFPAVDRALAFVTGEFLSLVGAGELEIHGVDARRNAHNAATYGSLLAEGWRLETIRSPGRARADADGVVGVRIASDPRMSRNGPERMAALVALLGRKEVLVHLGDTVANVETMQMDLFAPRF